MFVFFRRMVFLAFLGYCPVLAQQPTQIELVHAERMQSGSQIGDDVRRLIDNVQFRHEDAHMYCDSAYLFARTNSLRAFGNVFIQVSDTVSIYGDELFYNGNSRMAELTGGVRMVDPQMTLTTPQLFYDLDANTARYGSGGRIVDADNVLTSNEGFYYADLKHFFFRQNVVLVNPEYTMVSDTLKYNTLTEIAYFFGPTTIQSEENIISCRNGWYDTRNDIARFSKDAYFSNHEQSLTGDTLFYDRNLGYGRADRNIVMRDSVQNTIITGHFAEHFEAQNISTVTQEAVLTVIAENDSLFLHADTLKSFYDEPVDQRWVYAYHQARFFRSDLQGLSDSIAYSFADSTIYLYHEPVIWADIHQLTARRIEVKTSEEEVKSIDLFDAAFIVSEEGELGFNQVKGRNLTGHFRNNEIWRIDVFGNGETIYHILETEGEYVGMNKALASDIVIFVEDNKVSGIRFLTRPEAQLFPPDEIPSDDRLLMDFRWLEDRRPQSRADIFVWR
ncbi:MAG: OstA-like protein [Bacteroidales bacterium]